MVPAPEVSVSRPAAPSLVVLLVLAVAPAAAAQDLTGQALPRGPWPPDQRPNLLVVLADDVGVDQFAAYGEHPAPAHTPRIDQLAAEGLLFRNTWVAPGCSPTRALILTGRQGHRTGIGRAIGFEPSPGNEVELSTDEVSLADVLAPVYRTAALGKWHLSLADQSGLSHPLLLGFEHHAGAISNFTSVNGDTFFDFSKAVDGVAVETQAYATSDTVDDALALIDGFGDDPWFVWLAFHAAHAPYHAPPADLHTAALPAEVWQDPVAHMQAMVEALDSELGRLLDGLDPQVAARTVVVFLGDNGTPGSVTTAPFDPDHGKTELYEGGVNVPLILAGPGVPAGAVCEGLVSGADLFATLAELAGLPVPAGGEDSLSLAPYLADPGRASLRPWVYAEKFAPNGPGPYVNVERAARDGRHKLIVDFDDQPEPVSVELYDLQADPFEQDDLLAQPAGLTAAQQLAFERLMTVVLAAGEG